MGVKRELHVIEYTFDEQDDGELKWYANHDLCFDDPDEAEKRKDARSQEFQSTQYRVTKYIPENGGRSG